MKQLTEAQIEAVLDVVVKVPEPSVSLTAAIEKLQHGLKARVIHRVRKRKDLEWDDVNMNKRRQIR